MSDPVLRFPTEQELRARGGIKWNAFAPDVLPLWIAEMDFPVADVVRDALHAAVDRSELGYSTFESRGLTEAFARYTAQHYGQDIRPDWARVMADVLRAVALALKLRTPPGAGVIVPTPSYPNLLQLPVHLGYSVHPVPLQRDAGWALDLDAIDAAFAAGAHTLILIQPHNPTGRVFDRDELQRLSAIVERHGGRVIADEVHSPLTHVPHVAYSTVPGAAHHTYTATSAAKGWSIPGLKTAQLVAHNDADAQALLAASPYDWLGASGLGIIASEAAYRSGEPWREAVIAYLAEQGDWLQRELATRLPRLGWTRPDATYFAWLDLRPYGLGRDAAERLMTHGLAVNSGADFGVEGEGWVRLNYATTRPILAAALDRLERALSAS